MLGIKLLSGLFDTSKPDPVVEAAVAKVAEQKAAAVIGEPVLSLAKSILETDDWALTSKRNFDLLTFLLTHTKSGLSVGFVSVFDWHCEASWMTEAEKEYMVGVFKEYLKLEAVRKKEMLVKQGAATRERFMRELVEHHGQLEFQFN